MKPYIQGFLSALILSLVAACMTVPVSGRKAFNVVPEGIEKSMGEQSYRSILEKEHISRDSRLNGIITRVGQRIAAAADKPDYQWEFAVIDSNVQNAFCLPGGKIAVYRGLLPVAKNEAGLATVMAHEVTHAIARHGGQRMTLALGSVAAVLGLQQFALKDKDPRTQALILGALGVGLTVGVVLPYSRGNETEADEIGQILMARAGYDPRESIQFWHRFAEVTKGSSVPSFLSTHPSSSARAENMQAQLPRANEEYARAAQKYGIGEVF